jgi:hypothetical protein
MRRCLVAGLVIAIVTGCETSPTPPPTLVATTEHREVVMSRDRDREETAFGAAAFEQLATLPAQELRSGMESTSAAPARSAEAARHHLVLAAEDLPRQALIAFVPGTDLNGPLVVLSGVMVTEEGLALSAALVAQHHLPGSAGSERMLLLLRSGQLVAENGEILAHAELDVSDYASDRRPMRMLLEALPARSVSIPGIGSGRMIAPD